MSKLFTSVVLCLAGLFSLAAQEGTGAQASSTAVEQSNGAAASQTSGATTGQDGAQDSSAQQNAPKKPADSSDATDGSNGAVRNGEGNPNGQNHVDKRVFGVIPNNRTTSGDVPYEPITAGYKITIALKDSFDWPSYVTGAVFAGLYQLSNSNPSFGQGVVGYFHRFATSSGDQIIGNMMTEGFMPALFHQDPRYFMLGPAGGTKKHRLWHALISTTVAPMDSGKKTFNFTEWSGNAVAATVGLAYYPDGRTAGDTTQRWLTAIATDTLSNVMKEFWPDVKGWWRHKHPPKDTVPGYTGN